MRRHVHVLILMLSVSATLLAGCASAVFGTDREYALIAPREGALSALEQEDPLYEQFDQEVLSDAYLSRLLAIYENTTEAFLATNKMTPLIQALSNWPLIILGSPINGALGPLKVTQGEEQTRVALAIGLQAQPDELYAAREAMPTAIAPVLMRLVGLRLPEALAEGVQMRPDEPTTEELALVHGFALALEALHTDALPDLDAAALESGERLTRRERISENAYRYQFSEGRPTGQWRPAGELWRTPGAVATVLYRWLNRSDAFYPQRHMLWMTNYDASEAAYAKLLLAMNRLPNKRRYSLPALVESYAETFPAERDSIRQMLQEAQDHAPPRR